MTPARMYHGRALDSSGSRIAAAIGISLFLAACVFLACAWPYVENLPR